LHNKGTTLARFEVTPLFLAPKVRDVKAQGEALVVPHNFQVVLAN
jgi:hypothetical protein